MNSIFEAMKVMLARTPEQQMHGATRRRRPLNNLILGTILALIFIGCGLVVHCATSVDERLLSPSSFESRIKPLLSVVGITPEKKPSASQGAQERSATLSDVAALGRLEPLGEVSHLSVPGFLRDARVDRMFVHEGDTVEVGQIICSLDTSKRLQSSLQEAEQNIRVSKARLEQIKTSAKPASLSSQLHRIRSLESDRAERIAAQKAAIARACSQLEYASGEYNRFRSLYASGAVSASNLDGKRAELRRAQETVNEAKAELERLDKSLAESIECAKSELEQLSTVRQVDIDVVQEELGCAQANARKIKTDLDMSYLRAPRNGRILNILAREGEQVGQSGVVEIGDTSKMVAVAEIYQTDISSIRIGQIASITGDAFNGGVRGRVFEVGWKVERQNVGSDSPDSPQDRRVIEVKVLLDDAGSKRLQGLTDLEVEVRINVGTTPALAAPSAEPQPAACQNGFPRQAS